MSGKRGAFAIGTTGKGIGPCYADKINRIGIRIGELIRPDIFEERLRPLLANKNFELKALFNQPPLNFDEIYRRYSEYAKQLEPYVEEVESGVGKALREGASVLFEGAHGTFLDITFGTYPYVTSSSTLSAGICSGAGIGPTQIDHTLGVIKAYTTRVGNGPFPTALAEEEQKNFLGHAEAREIGTTTGRKRRMGWFDAVLGAYGVSLNGVDSLAVTKLDILDRLAHIKICTGYRLKQDILKVPPALVSDWENIEPVYETWPGWQCSTQDMTKSEDLPKNARRYLQRIEELCGVPISSVSLGPERHRTLFFKEIF